MFLVDTMVLSERSKAHAVPKVLDWLQSIKLDRIFISVVTIGEIQRGIRKLEQLEGRSATRHRNWLAVTLNQYSAQILPVTLDIARRWGPLSYDMRRTDPDPLIAATALEHDLTLVTRNVRHFEPTGVRLFDPYKGHMAG
ncbi:MAG: type II toxin-antitoxin system VapC family toxin [Rhizobiaceae bacterium]|nr:type II toxin-antitoxin system VapC family toxin [Rhizobiaceae bacterium]